DQFPGQFVFKGGTSLTKALRCVDRFSEDVDLLIVGDDSNRERENILKGIRDTVAGALNLEVVRDFGKTGKARDVHLRFPSRLTSRYEPVVRLEMGVRGADEPAHQTHPIQPMLADAFDQMSRDRTGYADLDAFPVPVLHPARTLWEKVVLLHSLVESGEFEQAEPTRIGRHYGDVGALLALSAVTEALVEPAERRKIDASVRHVSVRWFGGEPPSIPDGGYAQSRAFNPDEPTRAILEHRYDLAVDQLWAPTGRSSFREVLDRVAGAKTLLSVPS
ncbi:MAG: nucleotidyl transferase AbiEii/AbiGii toxin family protein, partial [Dehalococcoidia bacterium]